MRNGRDVPSLVVESTLFVEEVEVRLVRVSSPEILHHREATEQGTKGSKFEVIGIIDTRTRPVAEKRTSRPIYAKGRTRGQLGF